MRPNSSLTDQQEMFCQIYVTGGNAAEAARQSGYAPASARQAGYKLLQRAPIARRISDIRQDMADQGCRQTATLLGKLEAIYNRALYDGAYHAAARTVALQARLVGLMPSPRQRLWTGDAPHMASPDGTAENRHSGPAAVDIKSTAPRLVDAGVAGPWAKRL